MKELILAIVMAASCPQTKMENRTKYPWNDWDKQIKARCEKHCGEIYPDAPCLKLFIKWGKQDYHCICGK